MLKHEANLEQVRAIQARIVRKPIPQPTVFRDETVWGHIRRVTVQALAKKEK